MNLNPRVKHGRGKVPEVGPGVAIGRNRMIPGRARHIFQHSGWPRQGLKDLICSEIGTT